jgi:hypothetical protein
MFSQYYAEKMIDQRSREMTEVRLNAQRFREAKFTHNAPYFYENAAPAQGEAKLFHSQGQQTTTPRRTVRFGPVVIAW